MPGGVHVKQVFLSVEPGSLLVLLLPSESWSHMTFLEVVRDGYHDLRVMPSLR